MRNQTDPVTGLVGRRDELVQLERILASVETDGYAGSMLVHGASGMGKSALAAAFVSDHRHHCTLISAVGVPWERDEPYALIAQLLGTVRSDDAAALRSALSPTAGPLEIGQQLVAVLTRLAEVRTCLIIVDDAQWADDPSIQALSSALRRLSVPVLLLLLAARDDDDPEACTALRTLDQRVERQLLLSRFGLADVRELARRDGILLSAPAAAALADHCSGNPGLVRQLLAEHDPAYWRTRASSLATTSATLRYVAGKLASVSDDGRALAEAVGVIGQRAGLADAAAVAGLDDPVPGFDQLFRAGLVTLEGADGLATITIKDSMTRAAIYSSTGPMRRRELHERAAQVMASPADRLRHEAAALPGKSIDLSARLAACAREQADRGEWAASAKTMLLAAELSPRWAEENDRLLRGVEALVGSGDLVQTTDYVPEVEGRPESALRSTVLGYLAVCRGRPEEAERYLAEAWEGLSESDPPDARAMIARHRVLDSLARWDGDALVTWSKRSVELERGGVNYVESLAMTGLGLGMLGDLEGASRIHADALQHTGNSAQTQRVLVGQGWTDLADDRLASARRALELALPTNPRGGSTRISLWATGWLARVQFGYGDWDAALGTAQDGVSLGATCGIDLLRPLLHWTGAQIHALRGNQEEAEGHLHRIEQLPNEYLVMELPARMARAQVAEVIGDHETVIGTLAPLTRFGVGHSINAPGFWPWHDIYGEALVAAGRLSEADEFLRPHEELAKLRGHVSSQARLGQVRARWLAANGDLPAAVASVEAALALMATLPQGYELARIRRSYGQLLRRAGRRRLADTALHQARDAFASLDASVEVSRCDMELRISSSKPRRDARDLPDLTPQEQTVATLVASGRSNRDVASELFLSVKTVQYHLTRIYAKLGVRSRAELAARFADLEG